MATCNTWLEFATSPLSDSTYKDEADIGSTDWHDGVVVVVSLQLKEGRKVL